MASLGFPFPNANMIDPLITTLTFQRSRLLWGFAWAAFTVHEPPCLS